MRTTLNHFIRTLMLLGIISVTISCTDKKKEEDQNEEIMNENHTEMMEGNDPMHEDRQQEGDMMNDTTSMPMTERPD